MNMIAWAIVACEIAFWVVILAGLTVRYMLRMPKLGFGLLALTPLIDLLLLVLAGYDLQRGADATIAHALAAVYIGVSIAFGKPMIAWADERFRRYVLKENTQPVKRYGLDYARHYFKGWLRHAAAYAIGAGILGAVWLLVDDPSRTEALVRIIRLWSLVLGIDLLITATYFVWPKQPKAGTDRTAA